jgi:penicillin-binding protein 2
MENRFTGLNAPETPEFRQKFKVVFSVVLIVFTLLLMRLCYLQVIKATELRERSESNAVRFRKIPPMRGIITDRNGVVLADNLPSFDVVYMPGTTDHNEQLISRLQILYARKKMQIELSKQYSKKARPYMPVKLERNVGMEKVAIVEANSVTLPGMYVEVSPVRLYPQEEVSASLLGYTGEVDRDDLASGESEYSLGDIAGKHGVEKVLDSYLRGRNGAELVEVNVHEKEIQNLGRIEPMPGSNVIMTIDSDVQKAAWLGLSGKAGSAIALDPRDGAILAMVSTPSFNPHLFNTGITAEHWRDLMQNPLAPMTNKVVSGQYPPGSTYKLIIAAAGLEEGIITPTKKFFCGGGFTMGNRTFRCWKSGGHGHISLHRALVESCDVYFYNVGKLLGPDKIAKYARLFGLGQPTGIDFPNEKTGIVPSQQWKLARMKQPWLPGETISIAIGQGYNLVTPLQLANAYAAFANGGIIWQPHYLDRIESFDGKKLKEFKPIKIGNLTLKKETFDFLSKALWGVVNEEGGTGRNAMVLNANVCGKTGTSQVIGLPQDARARLAKKIRDMHKDHALFVCYAPQKNPEIAIAVIVENAGGGGAVAAPIARQMLEAYFKKKAQEKKPEAIAQNAAVQKNQ